MKDVQLFAIFDWFVFSLDWRRYAMIPPVPSSLTIGMHSQRLGFRQGSLCDPIWHASLAMSKRVSVCSVSTATTAWFNVLLAAESRCFAGSVLINSYSLQLELLLRLHWTIGVSSSSLRLFISVEAARRLNRSESRSKTLQISHSQPTVPLLL